LYGLSDPEPVRITARDMIFQHFLGFPGVISDFNTVCLFTGKAEECKDIKMIPSSAHSQY